MNDHCPFDLIAHLALCHVHIPHFKILISPSFPMRIEIGYSFLAQAKEEIIYVFCPKALASYSASLNSKTEYLDFLNEVKSIKEPQHLQNTFMSTTESGSPFTASGYKPLSLIANTIWITK